MYNQLRHPQIEMAFPLFTVPCGPVPGTFRHGIYGHEPLRLASTLHGTTSISIATRICRFTTKLKRNRTLTGYLPLEGVVCLHWCSTDGDQLLAALKCRAWTMTPSMSSKLTKLVGVTIS